MTDVSTTLLINAITKIANYCNEHNINWKATNVNHKYHELYHREAQFAIKITFSGKTYYLYFNDIYAVGSLGQGVESQFSSISFFLGSEFDTGPIEKIHIGNIADIDSVLDYIERLGGR